MAAKSGKLNESFEWCSGSVTGRRHTIAGLDNQDASCVRAGAHWLAAVVCDGCSSGPDCGVGAWLGARMVVECLRAVAPKLRPKNVEKQLEGARVEILQRILRLARSLGGDLTDMLGDTFLYTVIGALMNRSVAVVFSIGDGVAFVNGQKHEIAYKNDRPAYLTYALTDLNEKYGDAFRFRVLATMPTPQLETVILGTDGVLDLIDSQHKTMPGKSQKIGSIDQFLSKNRYYRIPEALTRYLARVNKPTMRVDWKTRKVRRELGRLPDDTTLIAIRRSSRERHGG